MGTTGTVELRRAEPADCAALAILNRELIEAEGHPNAMDVTALESRMHGWLTSDYRAIVAVSGERIVGYVLARDDEDRLYLRQLFVSEAVRRQGLGRRLVDACRDTSTRRLRVEVLVGNVVGLAFWRSIGFTDYATTLERER